jgi:hypothetical protein
VKVLPRLLAIGASLAIVSGCGAVPATTAKADVRPAPQTATPQPVPGVQGWTWANLGTAAEAFTDVSAKAWYASAAQDAVGLGLFSGYANGTFRPNGTITREEFVTALDRAFDVPTAQAPIPSGWRVDSWAQPYVEDALADGLLKPSDYTSVDMAQAITRQEIALLVTRSVAAGGVSLSTDGATPFSDVPSSSPYYTAVEEAARAGIVQGVGQGKFDPTGTATRAEAAAMLLRGVKAVPIPAGEQWLPYFTLEQIEWGQAFAVNAAASGDTSSPDLSGIQPYVSPDVLAGLNDVAKAWLSEIGQGGTILAEAGVLPGWWASRYAAVFHLGDFVCSNANVSVPTSTYYLRNEGTQGWVLVGVLHQWVNTTFKPWGTRAEDQGTGTSCCYEVFVRYNRWIGPVWGMLVEGNGSYQQTLPQITDILGLTQGAWIGDQNQPGLGPQNFAYGDFSVQQVIGPVDDPNGQSLLASLVKSPTPPPSGYSLVLSDHGSVFYGQVYPTAKDLVTAIAKLLIQNPDFGPVILSVDGKPFTPAIAENPLWDEIQKAATGPNWTLNPSFDPTPFVPKVLSLLGIQ